MEVIAFSVLSAVLLNAVCIVSFLFYRRMKKIDQIVEDTSKVQRNQTTISARKKVIQTKERTKKIHSKKKPLLLHDDNATGTESYTTEQQLVRTIIHDQQYAANSINTTALDEKPSVKRNGDLNRSVSNGTGAGSRIDERPLKKNQDPDWQSVISRRRKNVYVVSQTDSRYQFTLDGVGGIAELPFCEIHFPPDSVRGELVVSVETETYGKFVDDTEDKVFVTPAVHFSTAAEYKLSRQFQMKLNSMKMMGRGWSGGVCCQIESRDSASSWATIGRTEYVQGKPVNITADKLTSFRAVITRTQSSHISRDLNVAAYITKPKVTNPKQHYLHICIYDNSQQTQSKVNDNMQKLLLKMPPKLCNIPFGCNVEFQIEPTRKYKPDDKPIFMRWTEVCKSFVNVRFQIRLNRDESIQPNFEPEFRTMVFLTLNKVGSQRTWTQREYFHFYWMSASSFPRNRKSQRRDSKSAESGVSKTSDDDGFISGSDTTVFKDATVRPALKATAKSSPKYVNRKNQKSDMSKPRPDFTKGTGSPVKARAYDKTRDTRKQPKSTPGTQRPHKPQIADLPKKEQLPKKANPKRGPSRKESDKVLSRQKPLNSSGELDRTTSVSRVAVTAAGKERDKSGDSKMSSRRFRRPKKQTPKTVSQ